MPKPTTNMSDAKPHRENTGLLFKNEHKPGKEKNRPDYSGEITVAGQKLNVSGTNCISVHFKDAEKKTVGFGRLFRNRPEDKQSEQSPDYGGTVEINAKPWRVAGWLKDSKKQPGKKFVALAFTEPQDRDQGGDE